MLYDAVVDAGGNGDFRSIQKAIDAGRTRIFVRAGTYVLDDDIVLDSNMMIVGESKYTTIIDCNGSNQIKAVGDTPYETGTVSVTQGSDTITGSGTSWQSNLEVGDYIVFANAVHVISAINSDTELEISVSYWGATQSGLSYHAGAFKNNINIQNIKITGQSISDSTHRGALEMKNIVNSYVSDLVAKDNDLNYSYGIKWEYVFNSILTKSDFQGNELGFGGEYVYYSNIDNLIVRNNKLGGFWMDNSWYNTVSNVSSGANWSSPATDSFGAENGGYNTFNNIISIFGTIGIGDYYTEHNQWTNITAARSSIEGILINGSFDCKIVGFNSVLNGAEGLNIYGGTRCLFSNGTLKDNSQIANNTYSEISLTGTSTKNIIADNNIYCSATNKAKYGIREDSSNDDYNNIHGNTVEGAATTNISTQGANTISNDNQDI
jgi:hypothetical protein